MVLTGAYERSLDEKHRLALPKPFREALEDEKQLVLTPGTDGSIWLFSAGNFERLTEQLAARSSGGHEARAFSRLLYAQSHSTDLDSQGRIRLPVELAQLASIEGDVVIIGVGDHVELWNKSRWEAYLADLQPRYDELAESAFNQRPPAARPAEPVTTDRCVQPR